MKQVGNRRKTSSRSTQFTVDLDVRGMILLLLMATLTGASLFYLGIIFGKASRDPNLPLNLTDTKNPIQVEDKDLNLPKDLKIYDINDDPDGIKDFTSNVKKELQKTDGIIKSTETQIKLDEKKLSTDKTESTGTIEQPKTWPDQKTVQVKPANAYTIQVFVTKSKEKAGRITQQLRQKDFDAFVEEVSHQGNKLYKIRVGRVSKTDIPELKSRLEKVVGGMGMGLSVIKMD